MSKFASKKAFEIICRELQFYKGITVTQEKVFNGYHYNKRYQVDILIRFPTPDQEKELLVLVDCSMTDKILDFEDLQKAFLKRIQTGASRIIILNGKPLTEEVKIVLRRYSEIIMAAHPKAYIVEEFFPQSVLSENLMLQIGLEVKRYRWNHNMKEGGRHDKFQRFLVDLAEKFGFQWKTEYLIRFQETKGRIDVVWQKDGENIYAIEIDYRNRKRTIQKMLAIQSVYRIWVYLGDDTPQRYLKDIDPDGKIEVIRLAPVYITNIFPHYAIKL